MADPRENPTGSALATTTPAPPAEAPAQSQPPAERMGMFVSSNGLSGTQKMAILLAALGPERTKNILSGFSDDDIERIVKEIASMPFISTEQRETVLREAYEYIFGEDVSVQGRLMGGRETAKMLLREAVGEVRARNILDRLDIPQTERFDFVGDNDLENLAYYLENQLPQTAAVTMLHIRPEQAQKVLEIFPDKLRAEVVSRMVNIDKVDRKMVGTLRDTLEKHLEVSRNLVNLHGEKGASSLLRAISYEYQQSVLNAIGETNPTLRTKLEAQLLTFDDLYNIDDREFQLLVTRVHDTDKTLWPMALKACSARMKQKIYSAMTPSRREEIDYRLETMGRKKLSDVEKSQRRIVEIAKELAAEDKLTIAGTEPMV